MIKRPKDKGTGGEREVLRKAEALGLDVRRTPAGSRYDIELRGSTGRTIPVLATRADRSGWLATVDLDDLLHLFVSHGDSARIEVKRLKRLALHTMWEAEILR